MKRFFLALLLTGWIGCTPNYQSGKTLCSTAGECPSGMVCAPGNVCVTGGIPGHGGGGRTGGTTGGTGGSGGSCALSASDTVCGACGKTYCCAELGACQANSACMSLLACLNGCGTDTTCQSNCETTYSAGLADLVDAAVCADDYCSDACGSGGSGGSGGSITGGSGGSVTGGSGGSKTGGAGGSITGGAGGAGGTGSGGATGPVKAKFCHGYTSGGSATSGTLAKFCNYLQRNSADITLTLTVGSTTISALSGTCAPIATCSTITSGTNIAIALKDGTSSVYSGTLSSIAAGSNMLFTAEMDESAGTPAVKGASYATGLCSSAAAAAQAAPIDLEPLAFSATGAAMVADGTVDVPAGLYHALRGPRD